MANPISGLARGHPMELVLFVLLAAVLFSLVFGVKAVQGVLVDWLAGFFAALLFVFSALFMTQSKWKAAALLLVMGFAIILLIGNGTI